MNTKVLSRDQQIVIDILTNDDYAFKYKGNNAEMKIHILAPLKAETLFKLLKNGLHSLKRSGAGVTLTFKF